jgi:hypothetical protein
MKTKLGFNFNICSFRDLAFRNLRAADRDLKKSPDARMLNVAN